MHPVRLPACFSSFRLRPALYSHKHESSPSWESSKKGQKQFILAFWREDRTKRSPPSCTSSPAWLSWRMYHVSQLYGLLPQTPERLPSRVAYLVRNTLRWKDTQWQRFIGIFRPHAVNCICLRHIGARTPVAMGASMYEYGLKLLGYLG